ncbi:tetratricopeptide repeat protein [Pseudomonas putida]|uniref:tetratricopeptide repeat protein n=1 Tax=Pseudomonas putida TaxID=303 RepID=UPI0015FBC36E|nr:tetratricopeptide repeat protein [Pseudomonas putida]
MIQESAGRYYSFVRNEKSKDLLVIFSHLGRRPPKFAWYKVMSGLPANLLFVNCEGEEWYRNGIDGLGSGGINSTLYAIKDIAKSIHPQSQVYMAGGSMGGYGALLYGSKYGAKGVFASAAELILGLPGGKSTVLNRGRWSHVYPDLRLLAGAKVKKHVVYGSMHLLDTLSAGLYRGATSTQIYSVDGGDHAVSDTLAKRGLLTSAIERMLEGEDAVFDQQSYPEGLAVSNESEKLWLLNSLVETSEHRKALSVIASLDAECTEHPLVKFVGGMCHFGLGNWQDAKGEFESSYSLCRDYAPTPLHLGVIEARLKNYSGAISYLRDSLAIDSSPSIGHYQLGRVLQASGQIEEAIQCYKKAVDINPRHPSYNSTLESALKAVAV